MFSKTKEELALRLREEFLGRVKDSWGASTASVSLDRDGDVELRTEKGRAYVTRTSVIVTTKTLSLGSLSHEDHLARIATVADVIFDSRTPLRAASYDVRLYLPLRFVEPTAMRTAQSFYLSGMVAAIPFPIKPDGINQYKFAVEFSESQFEDTLSIEVGPDELDVIYGREGTPPSFSSTKQFAGSFNVGACVTKLQPLILPMIADPSRLRGSPFAQ